MLWLSRQHVALPLFVLPPPFTIELRNFPVDSSARHILCIPNQLEETLRAAGRLTSEEVPKADADRRNSRQRIFERQDCMRPIGALDPERAETLVEALQ